MLSCREQGLFLRSIKILSRTLDISIFVKNNLKIKNSVLFKIGKHGIPVNCLLSAIAALNKYNKIYCF